MEPAIPAPSTTSPVHRTTNRILWFGIVAACLIMIAAAVIISATYQREFARAEDHFRARARLLAEETDRSIQGVDLVLRGIVDAVRARGINSADGLRGLAGNADVLASLRAKSDAMPQIDDIAIADDGGDILVQTQGPPTPGQNVGASDYFRVLRKATIPGQNIGVPQPFIGGPADPTAAAHVARVITAANGGFLGIVASSIETQYFRQVFASATAGTGMVVSLWRADGAPVLVAPTGANVPAFTAPMLTEGNGWAPQVRQLTGTDGTEMAMFVPLPTYHLVLTVTEPESAVLREWRSNAVIIGAGGVSCAALALLLTLLLRRHMRATEAVRQSLIAEAAAKHGREKAERQLQHMQKMEAIDQLTAGIAHDFNNMLMSILGCVDALDQLAGPSEGAEDGTETGGWRRPLHQIRHSSERAAALTRKLLAFSRQQVLQPRPASLADIIYGMADLMRSALGPTIAIDLRIPADLWTVYVDPAQLEHVFLNLAINARDAMADGGSLVIEASNMFANAGTEREVERNVRVVFRDTGTGMTPATMARAFDPFFTTKPASKGTGLGLSQVYGIVRQSGGSVTIESEVGRGTSIIVYLPRSHTPVPAVFKPQGVTQGLFAPARVPDCLPQATVLVVDDDPMVREAVVQSVGAAGYACKDVDSGQAAMALLSRDPSISILLVDVMMPGMLGTELAPLVRVLRPDMPIVFMTGTEDPGSIGRDQHILRKPFRAADLRDMLNSVYRVDVEALVDAS